MPERLAVLGQSAPAAATDTAAYTVPAATQAVVSSIIVANTSATAATYRVHVRVAGAATAPGNAIFYDVALPAYSTQVLQLGLALAATTVVQVRASVAGVTFTLTGQEIS